MNCRETQQMIDRYLKNNLEESELQAFLDHVRECPSCYEELEIYYTIEYALGYLDNGKKGATNPTERLKEELKDKWFCFLLLTLLAVCKDQKSEL